MNIFKRCSTWWEVSLGLLPLLVVLLAFLLTDTEPISRATADRIKEGMTVEQVKALIGCPPGVYGTKEYPQRTIAQIVMAKRSFNTRRAQDCCVKLRFWIGDSGVIRVQFNDEKVA